MNIKLTKNDIPVFRDNEDNALRNVIDQMERFANSDISNKDYEKYASSTKKETERLWSLAGRLLLKAEQGE